MVRFFKKEIPHSPLYLPNGRRAPFKTSNGVGILATNDDHLLAELDKVLKRRVGGVIEIGEHDYLKLRDHRPVQKVFQRTISGISQSYIRWKIARGRTVFKPRATGSNKVGRFIHVLERHRQADPDSERRVLNAFWSWVDIYKQGVIPCHIWEYPRSAREIGDKRDLPYLKDVLLAKGFPYDDDDILILTNDDSVLHQNIIPALTSVLRSADCCSSFRVNFEQEDMPATYTAVEKVRQWGEPCLGRDLFAFRAGWLRLNWEAIPDFILGEFEWDLVMATMIRMASGLTTTKENFAIQEPRCEIDRGYVMHENHARNWMDDRWANSPAKIHNNRLAVEWFSDNKFESLIGALI